MIYWIKAKDGREYAVAYTQAVYMQLAMLEGVAMNNLNKMLSDFERWPVSRVMRFYWLAVKNGMRKAGKDWDVAEEDFIYWLDDDQTIMQQLSDALVNSIPEPDGKKPAAKQAKK